MPAPGATRPGGYRPQSPDTDEASGRHRFERLGVLKVQGSALDRAYLARTADDLDLAGLLACALSEAGLA